MSTRQKHWSNRSPEGPWDALVIGSGMGGMTTAAFLSQLGHRVLVLERHWVPGGFTHMFKRPGYEWDVGVHAVGEVTPHSLPGRLLRRLTAGRLQWSSLGPVYDEFHFPGDFRIDFPDNPKQFRENLVAAFPQDHAAVDGYLQQVREVSSAMRNYYLARLLPRPLAGLADRTVSRRAQTYLEAGTRETLSRLTPSPRLQSVLTSQWGYYGSTPSHSSFAMQALVTKHFLHGGYYPVGGSREIARQLLRTVAEAGGWTRLNAEVAEIIVEDGAAVGVRLAAGRRDKAGEEIRAKRVVSAAGILSTARRLLPADVRGQDWVRAIERLSPGPAHVCLYLGLKGDIRAAGASSANKWFYRTWSTEEDVWIVDGEMGEPLVLYCSFPSLKDPAYDPGPEQRHTAEVVTFVPWESFTRWNQTRWMKRGEDYDTFKQRMHERLLERFLEHVPGLRPLIDHAELSTPLSTDHFVRPMHGSIYGLEPTPARFRNPWLRPRSPIANLFFSGSEVATVGVIGAMMGGALAAAAVDPRGAFGLLKEVWRS